MPHHQAVASSGTSPTAYTGVWQAAVKIYREEGVWAYWKGNGVNVVRIFPYSAGAAGRSSQRVLEWGRVGGGAGETGKGQHGDDGGGKGCPMHITVGAWQGW